MFNKLALSVLVFAGLIIFGVAGVIFILSLLVVNIGWIALEFLTLLINVGIWLYNKIRTDGKNTDYATLVKVTYKH